MKTKKYLFILIFGISLICFMSGYFTRYLQTRQTDITIYLQYNTYIGVDMEKNKTLAFTDLSELIKYCNENNYKIIDIIDKTCEKY